ncbi:MAG: hypothetical protein C4543_01325 [Ignavibacteriales bacterium]|jgi:hypothetical protein|nr:MAG: hypothetical protein C4543_01325 [Ignavibacteriales bacterium]
MKLFLPSQIKQYLEKRANEKWLNFNVDQKFNLVVVVPAIKELDNIPILIDSLSQNDEEAKSKSLILFVINNSEQSLDDVVNNNEHSLTLLKKLKHDANTHALNIEYIDASSKGRELPSKDAGVGLARKIGMDQALLYADYLSQSLIVCLDADCKVESNYLSTLLNYTNKDIKAGVIKYAHEMDNEAIINYEMFLRYYVLGLKFADSPYAYHSIGSCMVIDPITYVKIGGMNKKKAGEDFYFLEKAAKLVEIISIDETTIIPSSRKSWRVPFGTGQRMTRFYKKVRDEYVLYDPQSFIILKKFLLLFLSDDNYSSQKILSETKLICPELNQFLVNNNFESAYQQIIKNSKSAEQLNRQKKIWFDSFKTLKLVHFLRDNGYPEMPMFDALNIVYTQLGLIELELHKENLLPSIQKQIEYLNLLRKLT